MPQDLKPVLLKYLRCRYWMLRERWLPEGDMMLDSLIHAEGDLWEALTGERNLIAAHRAAGGKIAPIDDENDKRSQHDIVYQERAMPLKIEGTKTGRAKLNEPHESNFSETPIREKLESAFIDEPLEMTPAEVEKLKQIMKKNPTDSRITCGTPPRAKLTGGFFT